MSPGPSSRPAISFGFHITDPSVHVRIRSFPSLSHLSFVRIALLFCFGLFLIAVFVLPSLQRSALKLPVFVALVDISDSHDDFETNSGNRSLISAPRLKFCSISEESADPPRAVWLKTLVIETHGVASAPPRAAPLVAHLTLSTWAITGVQRRSTQRLV